MENYTLAELTEFYFLGQAAMDTQFYFWVTVTFAAVVAGFVGGDKLTFGLRVLISVLYLLAAAVLVVRFVTAASVIDEIRAFLDEAGALINEPRNSFLILLRATLLIFGTAAAFFFLIRPNVAGFKRSPALAVDRRAEAEEPEA